jgi:hypothetical protein
MKNNSTLNQYPTHTLLKEDTELLIFGLVLLAPRPCENIKRIFEHGPKQQWWIAKAKICQKFDKLYLLKYIICKEFNFLNFWTWHKTTVMEIQSTDLSKIW